MLKTVLNVALYFIFPTPYHPHIWCGSWSVCVCVGVCVCVCVWLFLSFCFLFSVSYWLTYFCLVTIVLSCQSCLQNVKQKQKNLSLLLFFFLPPPHPPCYYYYNYYYYCMQRLKESCNFLDSVPGLPCAQRVEEKEGEKTRNKFFRG